MRALYSVCSSSAHRLRALRHLNLVLTHSFCFLLISAYRLAVHVPFKMRTQEWICPRCFEKLTFYDPMSPANIVERKQHCAKQKLRDPRSLVSVSFLLLADMPRTN